MDGASGDTLRNYVYGPDYAPLAQSGAAGAPDFFHADHLGTTRRLTDHSGSAITDADYRYTPFGALNGEETSTGRSLTSKYFTAQDRDVYTNLQYHRARWLDTDQGRWYSQDPVFDFPGNFGNGYGYVGGVLSSYDVNGEQLIEQNTVLSMISGVAKSLLLPSIKSMWLILGKGVIGAISQQFTFYLSEKQLFPLAKELKIMAGLVRQLKYGHVSNLINGVSSFSWLYLRECLALEIEELAQVIESAHIENYLIALFGPIIGQITAVSVYIAITRLWGLFMLLRMVDKYLKMASLFVGFSFEIKRISLVKLASGYITGSLSPSKLVVCQRHVVGYSFFNFVRASTVVNCQSAIAFLLFLSDCQEPTSLPKVSMSLIR